MDPTVVVAIAGLIGTSTGAVLSYRAGVATAREETERLREQHREDERRNRQGTYHQMLALVNELLWADREKMPALLERWQFVSAGVALFGAPAVVEKIRPLSRVLAEGATSADEEWREKAIGAAREVSAAMRDDIGAAQLTTSGGPH
jgi:hypothetical protein